MSSDGGDRKVDGSPNVGEPAQLSNSAGLALILLLVVAGCMVWWLQFRPPVELDATSIEEISFTLESWQGKDIPIGDAIAEMLRADSEVQRQYLNTDGGLVWLYVGYYGTARGGRPEHTPWACYPAAGWAIDSAGTAPQGRGADASIEPGELNELVVAQAGQRRLVHFWYQTHRTESIASETQLTIDHVLGRLSSDGRADGALVRLSTPIDQQGVEPARRRLRSFATALAPVLRESWPH